MAPLWRREDARTKGRGTASSKGTRRGVGSIEERFKQYDKNGDGKLTPEESPTLNFKRADENNDGVLTLDEVKAYYGSARRRQRTNEK